MQLTKEQVKNEEKKNKIKEQKESASSLNILRRNVPLSAVRRLSALR